MKWVHVVLTVVVAAAISYATVRLTSPAQQATSHESVYQRILRTNTIRCGYVVLSPNLVRDPATGNMSGPVHDILQAMAGLLALNVEYTEEVSFGSATEGLQAGRYDMICTSLYEKPNIMKQMEFVGPTYYIAVNAYARPDDTRFDGDITRLNDAKFTISSIDGTIVDVIATESFPRAQRFSLPELSPYSDNLLNVSNGKADVTLVESAIAHDFLQHHPGSLKNVTPTQPLRVFPVVFGLRKGEHDAATTFNSAIRHLLNHGTIESIIRKHERHAGDFIRVQRMYDTPATLTRKPMHATSAKQPHAQQEP